jgi:hypothetical protein
MDSVTAPLGRPLPRGFEPVVAPTGIESRPFRIRPGHRYTLSAWVRAKSPDTTVLLAFFEWADDGGDAPDARDRREATLVATTDWSRVELSGVASPRRWSDYVLRIVPSGTVWIDDVQLEEGEASEYRPSLAVEVGIDTATRFALVGDRVEVSARVAASVPVETVKLRYVLQDLWSRPVETILRAAGPGSVDRASFVVEQPGMYRVRVDVSGTSAAGEVWFGVFPRKDRRIRPESPFGTHVAATAQDPTTSMTASERMGSRWVRLHDFGDFCHWRVVEPESGASVWHDAEVSALVESGFVILANLGHPPPWAGRPGGGRVRGTFTTAPPRSTAEWESYVFRTVEHYRDRIGLWEIWNEPYSSNFFAGTPEEYAELLRAAHRAVKRADPGAQVVGGCFSPEAAEFTERVLAQGVLDSMDALSYHFYWNARSTEPAAADRETPIARHVKRYRELMRAHGGEKPILMTEGGVRCAPFASWIPPGPDPAPLEAAATFVRGMVEMLSAGVARVGYYYSGGAVGAMPWFSTMANGSYVLLDYDGRPKATMMAYSALEARIGECRPVRSRRAADLTAHLFRPSAGKGSIAVVWAPRALRLALPGVTIEDMMGAPLGEPTLRPGEPVFIVAPDLTPERLEAKLLRLRRTR